MRLAIIPARGGSKRIPRKNIKIFCGKPMIVWSIEAAIKSKSVDRIIVSTDDEEIAEIARANGAEAPFVRPSELAGDHVATVPVINHAIKWQQQHGIAPTQVCCVYATAPFVQADDISRGLTTLLDENCMFAFSVTSYAFPIQRAIKITPNNRVEMSQPEHFNTRSQDLEEAYHDAGQFYWGRTEAWLQDHPVFGPKSVPVILPRHRVQDIDTQEDWLRAEFMFKALQKPEHPTLDKR